MIAAYGDAETKRKALESGAEALFTKPIDFGALRSEIDTRVNGPHDSALMPRMVLGCDKIIGAVTEGEAMSK